MARTARLPRPAWIAIGAVAVALAGCSPITTQDPYAASDGVRVTLGDQVQAENLMVVTSAEGEPGVLLGGITNRGTDATDVTVTVAGDSMDLPLEGGQTVLLGAAATGASPDSSLLVEEFTIAAVPAAPGAMTDVSLSTPQTGSVVVRVPVLDGTLESYRDAIPTPAPTPTGEATAEPTPEPTPTP